MNFGSRIKQLRKQYKLTADDVAKSLGVSRATIYRYENGDIEKFPIELLEPMAKVLHTTPEYLMGWDNNTRILDIYSELDETRQSNVLTYAEQQLEEQNNVISLEEHVKEDTSSIYLVGETAAGLGREYTQLNAEQINTSVPKGADYALTVRGDSMEPLISDGSIVFYKEQPSVENGEVAIVEIDGSEVTCKKFYFDNNQIVLRSINDKYDDMVLKDGVRVIGKVIL